MRVKGLDGRDYTWKVTGRTTLDSAGGSSYHRRARLLLAGLFPNEPVLEEVSLPGTKRLRADFVVFARRLVVEVQGGQHTRFNGFMHKTPLGFMKSLQRDRNKRSWCELNGIRYVELQCDGTDDDWRRVIEDGGA